MTPEEWQNIKECLHGALELEPNQRTHRVQEIAAAHPALSDDINSLFSSYLEMKTDFLDTGSALVGSNSNDSLTGRQLGPYRIIGEIGKGGMGEVFRAVRADKQYEKQVAIKLVRAGPDSGFIVVRFRNERQILASLEHPNIARLLDGGATPEGIPYLVMELVEGLPINTYCDHHKLPTTERLKLFLQVCSAVQYAHQHLIVHRDIKPSNILVTSDGVPKLLDFGIAKILDPEAVGVGLEKTMTLLRVLTPAYASPEQVRGEAITTASDVYSLGVVLYELLTARSPYGSNPQSSGDISQAICNLDPEKPSVVIARNVNCNSGLSDLDQIAALRDGSRQRLRKRLRGDIDNIVMMALRKEPQRRYASVELFAADISRHLRDLPVVARGDSAAYRTQKFARRHKAGVLAATAVSLSLLLGMAITVREAGIARQERARAEQRFKDVRELANSDLFELHDAIQKLPGSASVRNLVIQRALRYLEKLSQDASGDRDLMHELATGYERVASLQGNFSGTGIGETSAALASYKKALAIRESLVAATHGDLNERSAEVRLMGLYVQALETAGKTGEASRIARQATTISEQMLQEHPTDVPAQLAAAFAHIQLGLVLGGSGSSSTTREIPEAVDHDRRALRTLEPFRTENEEIHKFYARARLLLAFHLSKAREFNQSEQVFNESIASENHRSSPSPAFLMDLYSERGMMLERKGDQAKALADYEQGQKLAELLVKASPDDLNELQRVQIAMAHITVQKVRLGRKDAQPQILDRAIAAGEQMFAANPSELFYRNLLAGGYYYQGEVALLQRKIPVAASRYSKALEMAQSIAMDDPDDLESRVSIAKIHDAIGVVQAQAGHAAQANQEFLAAKNGIREQLELRPQDNEALYVASLVEKHSASLVSCGPARTCGTLRWQLASPLN